VSLSDIILNKIKRDHQGKENAIKRKDLLIYCKHFESEMMDRKMRILVKTLTRQGICPCEGGYFYANLKEESDYSIEYLKKKIFPLWEDIKQIQEAYPQFYKNEQLELFSEII